MRFLQKQNSFYFAFSVKTDVVQELQVLQKPDTRQVVKKACQVNADAKKFPRTLSRGR